MSLKFMVTTMATAAILVPTWSQAATDLSLETMSSPEMAFPMTEGLIHAQEEMPTACQQLVLDDTQKAQLKTAHFNFLKEKNTLEAEVKNAQMDVVYTITDAASTKDQGTEKMTTMKTSMNKLGDAMGAFQLNVFYDIMKPEQRETAWKCMMEMKQKMMQERLKRVCANMPKDPAVLKGQR